MVAAKHPWAARAALDVLQRGGNAVDAAVTAAFAIGVVEPWMSGLGGGGFLTLQKASGERAVVDFFPRAPRAARADMYDLVDGVGSDNVGYTGVEGAANADGPLSVAVPGSAAGLALVLRRFGSIELSDALGPAIRFAEIGFPVGWYQTVIMAAEQRRLLREDETARIFYPDGLPVAAGYGQAPLPVVVQPDLARTLRRIAEAGPDGFYRGEVAERIVGHLRDRGGIVSLTDLADYQARVVEPLSLAYRDRELVLLPFQAGGVTVGEALGILAGFDLQSTGHNTATSLHLIAEASRRAFADRAVYVGDPDFCDTDWTMLSSAEYAARRRAEIDDSRASTPARGPTPLTASGCTTHLSVVDADGNMVSLTQTLTLVFGSGVTVPGTGVVLNDCMSLFDPRPGTVNSIAPGKRPASSMAHVIALQDGVPVLAVGAPGGRRIMDTCMQMVTNVIDYGLDIQAACGSPVIDCSQPSLMVDDRIAETTRQRLRSVGHDVVDVSVSFWPRHFASPTGVTVDPQTGLRQGGADIFAEGVALGI
ncbi:MAG: gamma-glutamyltransferase [Candidatus Dormibacteraeota bacterium]|nr:gamma-glutamyltransferase [Candidatus Dormibacteraeota bacterium]